MKTKFILSGGFYFDKRQEEIGPFYKEILKDAPEGARILLVPFAKEADRWPMATEKVSDEFEKNKWQSKIVVEVAREQNFIQQIKSADIIYFHGGQTLRLLEILKNYPELGDAISGKIVAGESAGANVWGNYFYSKNTGVVGEGLGILPVKIIPHYAKEFEGKLDNVGQDLELLALPEYEFRVFYK